MTKLELYQYARKGIQQDIDSCRSLLNKVYFSTEARLSLQAQLNDLEEKRAEIVRLMSSDINQEVVNE